LAIKVEISHHEKASTQKVLYLKERKMADGGL